MDFYTVAQAAARLGVSNQAITRYLRNGKIKGFRVGDTGPWRIDRADFDRFSRKEEV